MPGLRLRLACAACSPLLLAALTACDAPKPAHSSAATGPETKVEAPAEDEPKATRQLDASKVPEPKPKAGPVDAAMAELPAPPALDLRPTTPVSEGRFANPEGSDALNPHAVIALDGALLFAGQALDGTKRRGPAPSKRWLGLAPTGADAQPSSTAFEPGSIYAAHYDARNGGQALLVGTRGLAFDARAWFAVASAKGELSVETVIDTPNTTELFAVLPGAASQAGELAVVAGFVDAQAWVASLDEAGQPRWQKYVSSVGYTQARAMLRLPSSPELAVFGGRFQGFGESWWARVPGDGGAGMAGDDVAQDVLSIPGADENQLLRSALAVPGVGLLALGTARKNFEQLHDQLVLASFDPSGRPGGSWVVDAVRVTEVCDAVARPKSNTALVAVLVPSAQTDSETGTLSTELAVVELNFSDGADQKGVQTKAWRVEDSVDWSCAGFVDGPEPGTDLVTHRADEGGLSWRRLALPE
ncbi:hypothetical protein PPSIR1_25466 [Plesiocystis pacifica SIR-1]|uniref:Lipoprotein n=1 Tax=Plesiocystis pacifica SIR-1 TaxID=391625 RepID=A6FZA7_9BACT|nr:hypothetical protein [Plesiocystis pacifica]EDM80991.1 hypothetical protein PPSIR1_25466 [Plesiocystis pacifica SIR-1]